MKQSFLRFIAVIAVATALNGCVPYTPIATALTFTPCKDHKGVDFFATKSVPKRDDRRLYMYDHVCKDGTRVSYSWKSFSLWKEDLLRNLEFDWDKVPFIRFLVQQED
jgi:hypothetical protein